MLKVRDLISRTLVSVAPSATLRQLLAMMSEHDCAQVAVLSDRQLVGIVTEVDVRRVMKSPLFRRRSPESERMLDRMTVDDVMTRDPVPVSLDTPAYRAAEMMSLYSFEALPVMDGEHLVGIVSVNDFLRRFGSGEIDDLITRR